LFSGRLSGWPQRKKAEEKSETTRWGVLLRWPIF
jgi:hypothetical protein